MRLSKSGVMMTIMKYIILAMSLVILTSCSDAELSDKEYIEKAKINISRNETRAAIIHLKNAIQKNPTNAEARQLLGSQYIVIGSAKSAEKELNRALDLGIARQVVLLDYGKALLMQGEFRELVKELGKESRESNNQTEQERIISDVLLGHAYLGLGETEKAKEKFIQAGKTSPDMPFLLIGLANLSDLSGNKDKAIAYLDRIGVDEREYFTAQIAKGNIELSRNNLEKAIAVFESVVAGQEKNAFSIAMYDARLGLVRAYMQTGNLEKAESNADYLLEKNAAHPMANYLKAVILFTKKDYTSAVEYLQQVQKTAPNYPPGIFLLGATQYALNNFEEANSLLTRFVNMAPTHLQGRKLLALTRLRLNRPDEAMDILAPAAEQTGDNNEILSMIARVAAAAGEYNVGLKYISRMSPGKDNQNLISEELANLYYRKGSFDDAINELEKITGEKRSKAKAAQVYIYLRKRDFVRARQIAESLLAEDKSPKTHVLLGGVHMFAGERDKAQSEFNKALAINPDYSQARLSLANLYMEESKYVEAKIQLEKTLSIDAGNIKAMFGMAQISEISGNKEEAVKWIEKVRATDSLNIPARTVLSRYYLRNGDKDKALEIAQEAVKNTNSAIDAVRLLANVYMGRGEMQMAINVYNSLLKRETNNPQLLIELATIYAKEKRYTEARNSLIKARNIDDKNIKPKVALVLLEKETGNLAEAVRLALKLKNDYPDLPTGYMLSGDLLYSQKQYLSAVKDYTAGFEKTDNWQFYLKASDAYAKAGDNAAALRVLNAGIKRYPENISIQQKLANVYLVNGNIESATQVYTKILDKQPNNLIALNNLANFIAENDKMTALKYSDRAYKLAPENAAIADTHGWLLVETNNLDEGLNLLAKAAQKSQNPSIQYHYAVALYRSAKTADAEKILLTIKSASFPEQKAAGELLSKLSH